MRSSTDHGANNGIGEDPAAQGGTLTPASLTVKTPRGRGDGGRDDRGESAAVMISLSIFT